MFNFIADNLATIVVALGVAALILCVVLKMRRDKKQGKSACGCNCANCPSGGMCHPK